MVLWKCCQCTYGYISQREICALCGHDLCESCPRRTYNGHLEELPDRLPQPAKGRGVFQVKAVFEEGQGGDSHISDSEAAEGATEFDKWTSEGCKKRYPMANNYTAIESIAQLETGQTFDCLFMFTKFSGPPHPEEYILRLRIG